MDNDRSTIVDSFRFIIQNLPPKVHSCDDLLKKIDISAQCRPQQILSKGRPRHVPKIAPERKNLLQSAAG